MARIDASRRDRMRLPPRKPLKIVLGLFTAVLLAGASHLPVFATPVLPPQVQKAIDEAASQCDGHVVQDKGFITRRDVNGDGRPDYILSYIHFACFREGVRYLDWCGSAGCGFQVFVKTRSGYSLTDVPNAIGELEFFNKKGKRLLTYYVKEGPSADKVVLIWNGTEYR